MAMLFIVASLTCFFPGCKPASPSLENVIAKHTAAIGGHGAIESIQSLELQLHIVDPGFEVDGTYRTMRPGQMRIDVFAGGEHVFTEAFDGHRAWQWKGEGNVVEESSQATAALRHWVELPGKLFGLHELRGRGHHLALEQREVIDGAKYYVVRATLSDGYSATLYIDSNTWLITRRRDVRPLHVDVDPQPTTIETQLSDFREVGGVRFPFASTEVDLQTGKILEKVSISRVTVNPNFEKSVFERL